MLQSCKVTGTRVLSQCRQALCALSLNHAQQASEACTQQGPNGKKLAAEKYANLVQAELGRGVKVCNIIHMSCAKEDMLMQKPH